MKSLLLDFSVFIIQRNKIIATLDADLSNIAKTQNRAFLLIDSHLNVKLSFAAIDGYQYLLPSENHIMPALAFKVRTCFACSRLLQKSA